MGPPSIVPTEGSDRFEKTPEPARPFQTFFTGTIARQNEPVDALAFLLVTPPCRMDDANHSPKSTMTTLTRSPTNGSILRLNRPEFVGGRLV